MRRTTFIDLRQAGEWAAYLQSIGWETEQIKNQKSKIKNYLYIKKIPLTPWAIAKLQRPRRTGQAMFARLDKVCRKHRVVRLYVEPTTASLVRQLQLRGFSPTKTSYLPRKTIWLDLKKSERQLLAAMKPKTRYNIGLAQRRGIKIKVIDGDTLKRLVLKGSALGDDFYGLLRQNARRLGIFAMPRKWYEAQLAEFGKKCFVVLAYSTDHKSRDFKFNPGINHLVAGNFFMTSENACFYSHNGSTDLGRKLMAPTLCAWEGIREARRRRLKVFDFDGVDDGSRELKRWKGFSRFKEGFGGKKVVFSPQFAVWRFL
ncbi:MAG: peptidoglycan bridge formation glycyltransferase FemA/FemB family protein [Candidatus Chisholmbacteria bacterium]|nr:peptidoglycan bridge formation glycyltransferase FemA/FemB family protein [Candidatus Chisholmbacteria bacterium]